MSRQYRIKWNFAQVDRLRKAIYQYNRIIDLLESRQEVGYYDYIPARTSLLEEMEQLKTRQQLQRRINELKRIKREKMQDQVEFNGYIVPRFLKREILSYERDIEKQRKDVREYHYNWDEMTPQQQSIAMARGNISKLEGKYYTGEDLKELMGQYYSETDEAYFDKYITEWRKYCTVREFEQQVIDDIEWLLENKPGIIRIILDRGDDQAQIEYIYINSANFLDAVTRHKDIARYWREKRLKYSSEE